MPMKRSPIASAFLLLSLALLGCQCPAPANHWDRTEVYFGLSAPDGSLVSAADFQKFVDDVITPQFPAGLTIVDASGQWRNATGHIDHEPSKVLIILHPPGADIQAKIDTIRREYRQRFHQEAVLKVTTPARVDF